MERSETDLVRCIHVARKDVLIDGVRAWKCLGCGEVDYDRWQVRIDSAGHMTEVHFDTGERREHAHTWMSGRSATGLGFVPHWHCSPCMSGRGADVESFFNLLRAGWRSWR